MFTDVDCLSVKCPHCSLTFHKHTKLRAHVLDQHREALLSETRASTPKRVIKKRQTPAPSENASGEESDGDLIRAEDEPRFRPFKCLVSGCGWDFETAQRLKVHARVHQGQFEAFHVREFAEGGQVC